MFFEKSLVKFLGVGALNFVSSACLPAAQGTWAAEGRPKTRSQGQSYVA